MSVPDAVQHGFDVLRDRQPVERTRGASSRRGSPSSAPTARVDELVVHQPADARDAEPGDSTLPDRQRLRPFESTVLPPALPARAARSAAGVVAVSPYLGEARGVRGAARRRQPGHPRHDLPGAAATTASTWSPRSATPRTRRCARRSRSRTATRSATGSALHPSLPKLKARFDQGKVAIVRGVGYQPPDLSHFTSGDIWMHGWGGSRRRPPVGSAASSTASRTPSTSRCTASGCTAASDAHLAGAVSHASSLPLSIDDAFGIDRSDRVRRAHVRRARSSMGNGASGLGALGDLYDETEIGAHAARAAHPRRRTGSPTSRPTSQRSSCSPRTSSTPTSASA